MGLLTLKLKSFFRSAPSTATLAPQEKLEPDPKAGSFKRIAKEVMRELVGGAPQHVPPHVSFGPLGEDIYHLQGIIMGPSDTPYEGGIFLLSINVPADYPFRPPKIKFKTKVHHHYISNDGTINVDILGENWSPALSIEKVMLSICSVLCEPPNSGKSSKNKRFYNKKAAKWTRLYAIS